MFPGAERYKRILRVLEFIIFIVAALALMALTGGISSSANQPTSLPFITVVP